MSEPFADTLAIGIDLGATKIAAALVTPTGETVAEARLATAPREGPAAVIARLGTVIAELLAQSPHPVVGIGIGSPGFVDSANGIVRTAVNLGWTEVDVVSGVTAEITAHTGRPLPVWIENDANVQALGEYVFGAARDIPTFVNVAIGSGLGGGVIVNGKIVAGASYMAAEIGHFSFDPWQGRACPCGLRGCVETVVSGGGLVQSVYELATRQAWNSPLTTAIDLTGEQVVQAARSGDPLAQAALTLTAEWLGLALGAYVAVLNPPAFVIGGGLGLAAFDLLIPGALAAVAKRTLPQSYQTLQILPSQVPSTTVGAAALVWHGLGA